MGPKSEITGEIRTEVVNDINKVQQFKVEIVWRNVIGMIVLHILALYSIYRFATEHGHWRLLTWVWAIAMLSSFGVLAGAHRLWAHRTYKAKWQLRLILMIMQTVELQNDIYEWCRDHRVHHKYSETDADPHNSNRGFFFAHMGWLLCKKHPDVRSKGKNVDLSDLWADPIVRFQRRFYIPLLLLFWLIIPVYVPMYFWGESFMMSLGANFLRYVISLHQTWLVNSAAHLYGNQPYDRAINPRENRSVVYATLGEGYHNYHHAFPWDYSASEFGWRDNFNPATAFIDLFATIGWAYDRKEAPKDIVEKRLKRTGDGSVRGKYYMNVTLDYCIGIIMLLYPFLIMIPLNLVFAN